LPIISNQEYGFAFVDGDHRVLPTLFDVMVCAKNTQTVAVHDYQSSTHQDVNTAVDFFIEHSGWKKTVCNNSLVVLRGEKILDVIGYPEVKIPN